MRRGFVITPVGVVAAVFGAQMWYADATDTVTWCSGPITDVTSATSEEAAVLSVSCLDVEAPLNGPDFGEPTEKASVTLRVSGRNVQQGGLELLRDMGDRVTVWSDRHEDHALGVASGMGVHKDPAARKRDKIAVGRALAVFGGGFFLAGLYRLVTRKGKTPRKEKS